MPLLPPYFYKRNAVVAPAKIVVVLTVLMKVAYIAFLAYFKKVERLVVGELQTNQDTCLFALRYCKST